jgi:ligand-binding sensor domain-containing protein/putative methionine-R-sulfoxide reductase with GAF domain
MNLRSLGFLILLIIRCSAAGAQQTNFQFNHIGTKKGLSHGIVNAFCQDKDGFMWIGTFDGLNRFDGTHFTVYKNDKHNRHSLINNTVHDVCVDKQGNVWCATEGGVSRYNMLTATFDSYLLQHAGKDGKNTNMGSHTILCDRHGAIWCSSTGGLFGFDAAVDRFINYCHDDKDNATLASDFIHKHDMAEDLKEDRIWFGSEKGIQYFDTKTKKAYHVNHNPAGLAIFSDHNFYPLTIDNYGKIICGDATTAELCTYDPVTNKMTRSKAILTDNRNHAPTSTADMFVDSKNNLWVSTWAYLNFFRDGVTGKVLEVNHDVANPKSINSNFFWDVFEDREGTLWFGGLNGISYFNPQKVTYTLYRPDLQFPELKKFNRVYNFYEDKNEVLWFGSVGAGLFSYDFRTDKYENFNFEKSKGLSDDHNSVFYLDGVRDEIWCGTNNGIHIFNPVTKKFRAFTEWPSKDRIDTSYATYLAAEKDSAVWFHAQDKGFIRYNYIENTFQKFSSVDSDSISMALHYISSITVDTAGGVWIGTWHSLLKYNAETRRLDFYKSDSNDSTAIPDGYISRGVLGRDGNFWSTVVGQGIFSFNPKTGKAKTWNESDGLVFNHCGAISMDKMGRLWMVGYNLVSVFEPSKSHFENFAVEFAEDDYQYRNRLYRLRDGRIASPMLGAFVVFDPEKQARQIATPKVIVSSMKIFEKPILFHPDSTLNLSYKENFFSFDYSVFTGVDRDKIQYSYMLEGFDKDWVNAGIRQTASYTNVPGGDYVFKVRARTGNVEWSPASVVIPIHISKIYYQTWWFQFLVAVLIFLVIRFYVRFREQQQIQKEAKQAISYFANSEYTNHSADEILWDMARNCISRLDFIDCVIYMYDEQRNILVQKAALGEKSLDEKTILNPIEIPVGKGIVGSVAMSGKTAIVKDTSKDGRYIQDDAMRLSEIAVPIIYDGKVIGVIDSEHPQRNFFHSEHQRILETIASICATKIVNAQSAQQIAENEKKLLELDKRSAENKMMALRAQMNPHFIFNALNSIQKYILQNDADNAELYLEKFAKLIRLILDNSRTNYVQLNNEVELLTLYLDLEMLRFQNRFEYKIEVDGSLDEEETEIPSMIVQPFVENAILHGLNYKETKGYLLIEFRMEDGFLKCVIEDDGVGRKRAQELKNKLQSSHKSVGLKVTEERLEVISKMNMMKASIKTIDLMKDGNAAGTRVEILFPVVAVSDEEEVRSRG